MAKKRPTPMQLKKDGPRSMEAYAKKRQPELLKPKAKVTIAEARPFIMHDPEGDLHHLMRAAEIKQDKKRQTAAEKLARERIKVMKHVVGGTDEA